MVCNSDINEVATAVNSNYQSPALLSLHLARHVLTQNESTREEGELEKMSSTCKDYQEFLSTLSTSYRGGELMPDDEQVRERQFKILARFLSDIKPYFDKTILLASPREGHDLFLESLAFLENELVRGGGKFLAGSAPNFLDFGVFPYLDKIGKWMPEFEPYECIKLHTWKNHMRNHPTVTSVMTSRHSSQTDEDTFKQMYIKDLQRK